MHSPERCHPKPLKSLSALWQQCINSVEWKILVSTWLWGILYKEDIFIPPTSLLVISSSICILWILTHLLSLYYMLKMRSGKLSEEKRLADVAELPKCLLGKETDWGGWGGLAWDTAAGGTYDLDFVPQSPLMVFFFFFEDFWLKIFARLILYGYIRHLCFL